MEVWGLKEVSIVYLGLHGGLGVEEGKYYIHWFAWGLKKVNNMHMPWFEWRYVG